MRASRGVSGVVARVGRRWSNNLGGILEWLLLCYLWFVIRRLFDCLAIV